MLLQSARPYVSVTQGATTLAPLLGVYWAFSPAVPRIL